MSKLLQVIILSVLVLSGCSSLGVQPWERDLLAQKKMQLDPYPLDTYLDEHIYYSKESSSGGKGVGGGGCGCN
ncbi:MAG: DUF4266 domain-containing protein [Gammaproteobacteria bacterium]